MRKLWMVVLPLHRSSSNKSSSRTLRTQGSSSKEGNSTGTPKMREPWIQLWHKQQQQLHLQYQQKEEKLQVQRRQYLQQQT
jgi:hypothetical protein